MKIKSLFLSVLAMTGMLAATSCSQDELVNESVGNYVNARFSVETPEGIETRAIGDGTQADVVTCAVFDENGEEMVDLRKDVAVSGKKAVYEVRLAKGQSYRIAFFAYNKAAEAYDVTDMKNIVVKAEQKSNVEARDAFTAYTDVKAEETMNSIERDVVLYRPFAQLNLGAYKEDITAAAKAGVVVEQSQVKVSNVYSAFSAYDDAVAGETSTVTFALNTIPAEALQVDVNGDEAISATEEFEYLALNYLLVGDKDSEKALTDVEFVWETADGKTNNPTTKFSNVPVQRNYRTNIIGYLLTNPAQFNIIIDSDFETPDYIVSTPWDGVSVAEPTATATEYLISTPAEWVWLKANKKAGMNIKLMSNLDFGGYEVTGLHLAGELDGQGYTMSNMTLLCGASYYANGLLCPAGDATVKNLTIENVKAECAAEDWGYVGAVFGDVQGGDVTLSDVHVKNADLCGVQSVGGLVGLVANGSTLNIDNCSVNGSHIYNYAVQNESGQVASLVGKVAGTLNIGANVSVADNVIDGYWCEKRKEASIDAVAAIDGNYGYGTITGYDGVAVSNVTVNKTSMADVVVIKTAAELSALNVTDKIVLLAADIDFEGAAMTAPVNMWGNSTFDGQGYKISNVVCALQGGYATALFRGDANGGTKVIKNLKVEGITAKSSGDPSFAAAIWSDMQNGVDITIENVHISGANVSSNKASGGFVGFIGAGSTGLKISNSSISNSTIVCTNTARQGALVGRAYGCGVTLSDVTVSGVTVGAAAATENTLVGGENSFEGSFSIK